MSPFTLTMPKLSPTMTRGTIVRWHKKEGDFVEEGDLLFEVMTDKTAIEYRAIDPGFLRKILVKGGEEALVYRALAILSVSREEEIEGYKPEGECEGESAPASDAPLDLPRESEQLPPRVSASPLAKKRAREEGVDLSTISGSGPGGRIMSRDLDQRHGVAALRDEVPVERVVRETLSSTRRAIGKKVERSKREIPHFYVQQDIDVEKLVDMRQQFKEHGIEITINDMVVRAVALSLKKHPAVNSGFDAERGEVIRFQTIDIAIAVDAEGGVLTPIVYRADTRGLKALANETKRLVSSAKRGQLQPHEYRGGSFTLSNLGMFGIHSFQAIVNPPQVSILSIGGIRTTPVVKGGAVIPGKKMMVSLSSDHRIVDGADAARFLATLKARIEAPATLLL